MSPRGRVRAILVALAHLYVVLTCLPLQEEASYLLPFPDCIQDLAASAALPSQVNLLYHIPSSLSRPSKNFFRFFFALPLPCCPAGPSRNDVAELIPHLPTIVNPSPLQFPFFLCKKKVAQLLPGNPFRSFID